MNHYIGTINTVPEKINLFGEYKKFVGPFLGDESEINAMALFDNYFKDNPIERDNSGLNNYRYIKNKKKGGYRNS